MKRVVEASELGMGATDDDVRTCARRTGLVPTAPDDVHVSVPPDWHAGVFYGPNQRLSSFTLLEIVHRIEPQDSDSDGLPRRRPHGGVVEVMASTDCGSRGIEFPSQNG